MKLKVLLQFFLWWYTNMCVLWWRVPFSYLCFLCWSEPFVSSGEEYHLVTCVSSDEEYHFVTYVSSREKYHSVTCVSSGDWWSPRYWRTRLNSRLKQTRLRLQDLNKKVLRWEHWKGKFPDRAASWETDQPTYNEDSYGWCNKSFLCNENWNVNI